MKYIKYQIILLLAAIGLFSCEEREMVTFKGGASPVLTSSADGNVVLSKDEENFNSLQFHWTDPQYEFSNGVNTQEIHYTLEIDNAGSNFQSPNRIQLGFINEVFTDFKVRELNNTLSALEQEDYVPHDFEFRVKATLANSSVPVYSNVVTVNVTTYLDVVYPVPDKLYITGAATPKNWMAGGDAPDPTQEFTKINPYTFQLSLPINGSNPFLFVPVYGNWDNKYGYTGAGLMNNPNGDTFRPGGNDMVSPAASRTYTITVNFKTGRYSFE